MKCKLCDFNMVQYIASPGFWSCKNPIEHSVGIKEHGYTVGPSFESIILTVPTNTLCYGFTRHINTRIFIIDKEIIISDIDITNKKLTINKVINLKNYSREHIINTIEKYYLLK